MLCSWSGGKDSCYALMRAIYDGFTPKVLLNMMNENGLISRSHAISKELLTLQAHLLQLPIKTQPTTWGNYESNFIEQLNRLKEQYNLHSAVFGDIDIQAHRDWEESVCKAANLKAVLPLWQKDRKQLVIEMLDSGIEALITSCNLDLGSDFLGKTLTLDLVNQFEKLGVDVCGENGEFHTLVVNCPLFKDRLRLPSFTKQIVGNYCFLVWDSLV